MLVGSAQMEHSVSPVPSTGLQRNSGSAQHWLREAMDAGDDSLRKAVIPIAGLGTRMFPISALVPKAFLPIIAMPKEGQTSPPLVRPFLHTVRRGSGPSPGLASP